MHKLLTFAFSGAILLSCALAPRAYAQELTAKEIIDKALDQNGLGFYSGVAKLRLTYDDGAGSQEVKELIVKSRTSDDDTSKAQVTLLAPPDLAGEAYLFLGNPDREDDVYMYLPAFKETRKVSGTDKKGKFLGTHLTYRDLETRDIETGSQKRLTDEKIGPHDCYVIESVPKEGEDTDYGRVVTWVRQKDYMPLRVEFYDRAGTLVKRLFSERISKQGDTRYVKTMSLHMESGGSTTVEVLEVDFNAELPDRVFSKEALGQ